MCCLPVLLFPYSITNETCDLDQDTAVDGNRPLAATVFTSPQDSLISSHVLL